MKFRIRKPSWKKSLAARASWKRVLRHSLGLKAPRGYGWITNPKRAAYNRVYSRTAKGCGTSALTMLANKTTLFLIMLSLLGLFAAVAIIIFPLLNSLHPTSTQSTIDMNPTIQYLRQK